MRLLVFLEKVWIFTPGSRGPKPSGGESASHSLEAPSFLKLEGGLEVKLLVQLAGASLCSDLENTAAVYEF